MRRIIICVVSSLGLGFVGQASAESFESETVYVEVPFDTDGDGRLDRIYVKVDRPSTGTDLPAVLVMTPYALGGNDVPNHEVDVRLLPQDSARMAAGDSSARWKTSEVDREKSEEIRVAALQKGYVSLAAHSLGTGYSTGCPSVGDMTESLAAKAVIDWVNGRAPGYNSSGRLVTAGWASGAVGMMGVSYNGTLPNMVATTGVEGLKAIVPVAAISSWYDYYRANGLVVGPGGYIGEDADVLAKFIARPGTCSPVLTGIEETMGREHGDFSMFWQDRDYVARADGVKAAVFIMHGQADWNVRQRHAIRWWEALEGRVPLKMWLHKGGHEYPSRSDTMDKIWEWFDRYVKGVRTGIDEEFAVEIETPSGTWTAQRAWPHEQTSATRLYLNEAASLTRNPGAQTSKGFVDSGKTTRLESLLAKPTQDNPARLAFLTEPLSADRILSGTSLVNLDVVVTNRRAANLTVAIIEYDAQGSGRVVTRGWADPQNHADFTKGELLVPGQHYTLRFEIEPKQYTFTRGKRIGVVVTGTDYDQTIRPDIGTEVVLTLGMGSFVELRLSGDTP